VVLGAMQLHCTRRSASRLFKDEFHEGVRAQWVSGSVSLRVYGVLSYRAPLISSAMPNVQKLQRLSDKMITLTE